MDGKDTFYCSFVSDHYIICECGDTFPTEDALKEHLENGHDSNKNEIVKTEDNVAAKEETVAAKEETVAAKEENVAAKEENIAAIVDNVAANEVVHSNVKRLYLLKKYIKQEAVVFELPAETETKSEETCHDTEEIGPEQFVYEILPIKKEPEIEEDEEQVEYQDEVPHDENSQYFDEVPIEVILQNQMSHEHNYKKAVKLEVQEFFFCEVCGKSFASEKSVKKHANMHVPRRERLQKKPKMRYDKTKKVVCELCGKKYASNAALRYHQRVHTGEKPYTCDVCSKSFTMPLFLQIHTRIHTGERPYQCSHCPKAFSNKAALLRHDRVHTGEKPYTCPQCFKKFTQSNSMKLHVKTVHMKMPTPYKSKARRLKALMRQAALQQDGIKSKSKPDKKDGLTIKLVPSKQELYEMENSQDLEGELIYDEESGSVTYHKVYEG